MFGSKNSCFTGWNVIAICLTSCLTVGFMSQHSQAQTQDKSKPGDVFETIDPVQDKKVQTKDPFGKPPADLKKEAVMAPKLEQQKDPFKKVEIDGRPETKKTDPFGIQDDSAAKPGTSNPKTNSENSGTAATKSTTNTTKQEPANFDDQFWRYLSANNYKNWAPVPGKTGDFYDGQSPHGKRLKMYLNRTAAGNPATLPNGSVVIKENYGADKTLKAITVMYRSKGYNPDAGDWYWIKYNPDGTVATTSVEMGSAKISGAFKSCIECHSGADGNDYSFFNDN